jgi:hypothetical protein
LWTTRRVAHNPTGSTTTTESGQSMRYKDRST